MIEKRAANVRNLYVRRTRTLGVDGTEALQELAVDLRANLPHKWSLVADGIGHAKLIAETISRVRGVSGAFAEVGCWKGGTGWFMRELMRAIGRSDDKLFLYDTFCGYVDMKEEHEDDLTREARYKDATVGQVEELFGDDKNVFVKEGVFPDSAAEEKKLKFAFVHLDVDTYESTKSALAWLEPRMSDSGAILMDDWQGPYARGATKAIREFADQIDGGKNEILLFPRKAIFYKNSFASMTWADSSSRKKKDPKRPPKSNPTITSKFVPMNSGHGPTIDPDTLSKDWS